jgi:Arc/MetJ family transcription regulator
VSRGARVETILSGPPADVIYRPQLVCAKIQRIYTVEMKRTVIEIDEDLLAEATEILRAATMKEAVNEALRFVVTEKRRRQSEAIESLGDWFAQNPFDKDDAWR